MIYVLALLHLGLFLILLGNLFYLRRRRRPVAPDGHPVVSILIPARNEEDNLRRLIPSLLSQDYPGFEIIIYDDGSEDNTWNVIQSLADERVKAIKGSGPPPGWVGKVHALYQATRRATGSLFLFLDADAELLHPEALRNLVGRFQSLPPHSVMTGMVRLLGGAKLLVSLVPNAILTGLPWPLVRRLPFRALGALNGQCWLIDRAAYRRFEPHLHHKDEVLEDVVIGRYLKDKGITPVLFDLKQDVSVYMYRTLGEAWHGFRKNAYLILGGHPLLFFLFSTQYFLTYILAPFISPWLLLSVYLLKAFTDRITVFPPWVTLLTPLSYLLGLLLQFDSALSHWTGRVSWKGRRVG
ncbi:MAG: glycosyltransferase [Rhodothermales bacterium]